MTTIPEEHSKPNEDMGKLRSLVEMIAKQIHPDTMKITSLIVGLKNIKNVNEALELSDPLSEKLMDIQIDLYALIKDIMKERGMPETAVIALDTCLKKPGIKF